MTDLEEYEDWEGVRSLLSEFFNEEYVDINKLTEYAVSLFLNEIAQNGGYNEYRIAAQLYNTVIPLPTGIGIGELINDNELTAFADDLNSRFEDDHLNVQNREEEDPSV
jgi:hypothetical protein